MSEDGYIKVELEGHGVKASMCPQDTEKELEQAMRDTGQQYQDLFAKLSPEFGIHPTISAAAASLGCAIGAIAQQKGATHEQMQQILADYLQNTLASADASFKDCEKRFGGKK